MKDPRNEAKFKQLPFERQNRLLLELIFDELLLQKQQKEPPRTLSLNRVKNACR